MRGEAKREGERESKADCQWRAEPDTGFPSHDPGKSQESDVQSTEPPSSIPSWLIFTPNFVSEQAL